MSDKYFYVACESMAYLALYLGMVIGPCFGVSEEDLKNENSIDLYFDPLKRTGVSIFLVSKEERIPINDFKDGKNDNQIDAFLNQKKIFFLSGLSSNKEINIDERLREVCSMCFGGIEVDSTFNGTKVETKGFYFTSIGITVGSYEAQKDILRKCVALEDKFKCYRKIAADDNIDKRLLNLAYGLCLVTGYTFERNLIVDVTKREDAILTNMCDKIDKVYFSQTPDPYLRAYNIGRRLNTLGFVVWAYKEYGVTNLKEVFDNYDSFSTSYSDWLQKKNYIAPRHLRFVKEMLKTAIA